MEASLPSLILNAILHDEVFCRKALPYIKPEYFEGGHRVVYELALSFIAKYNKLPNAVALEIELGNNAGSISSEKGNAALELIHENSKPEIVEIEWLLSSAEKWCQDRALFIAIMESMTIIEGKNKTAGTGVLPELFTKALAVSFDSNVGHDYLEAFQHRYDYYHIKEEKIPFDLEMLNKITDGGVSKKTLNVILAGTAVGKSLAMCHFAASNLALGKNVLYITLEMSEERIAERIDANLFDVQIDQLKHLPQDIFAGKVKKIADKTKGKLIIKEYPTASAHVGHFRALLNELKLKKSFVPDIIYIDYINICASSRIKGGADGSGGSYAFIKAIAEELRGLAVEFNVPVWTATQVNRTGFASSDVEITDTAESFGLPATSDLMIALIGTEQLDQMGQIMVKQLKNRYNDATTNKRFVIGRDKAHMRLYDVADSAQNNIMSDAVKTPPVVASPFGQNGPSKKKSFAGLKV